MILKIVRNRTNWMTSRAANTLSTSDLPGGGASGLKPTSHQAGLHIEFESPARVHASGSPRQGGEIPDGELLWSLWLRGRPS
jgi:hypothetical protein